ncbi:MAG: SpoIIE family protein phosphatase [Acidobacteria bacterium]|nr:SpoIIE family protein phosphatase [Acidobacteriota bacterium]
MASNPPYPPTDIASNGAGGLSGHLSMHAVNVFVRDQDASLRFYVDQLGFDVAFDARLQTGDRWVAVSPPDGTAVLALVAPKEDSKQYGMIGRSTGVVFVTENVTAQYTKWRKRGVRFKYSPRLRRVSYERPSSGPHGSAAWGGVFTRFHDIDGNTFELVGFDEVTREIQEQRRLRAEKAEAERRLTQEMEIAKQVQARLFPQRLPAIRTLEYAGTCIQAQKVGGDYYDCLELGQDRFALVLGDIAGKGIAAALLMANLQASLRSQCAIALDRPQVLLRSVNRLFYENSTESAYATLFFAEYDDRTRRLRYSNCGHLAALLLKPDNAVEKLDSTGTVLGLFPQWDCSLAEHTLFPGDTLVLYTDGITEAFNETFEDFGEHRLIDALQRNREQTSRDLVASVVAEVQQFSSRRQSDDITLMVAKCRELGDPDQTSFPFGRA